MSATNAALRLPDRSDFKQHACPVCGAWDWTGKEIAKQMNNNLLDIRIRITPSDKDHACLIAEDLETGSALETRYVTRKDLVVERDKLATEMLNRVDVRSVGSPAIPKWAKETK